MKSSSDNRNRGVRKQKNSIPCAPTCTFFCSLEAPDPDTAHPRCLGVTQDEYEGEGGRTHAGDSAPVFCSFFLHGEASSEGLEQGVCCVLRWIPRGGCEKMSIFPPKASLLPRCVSVLAHYRLKDHPGCGGRLLCMPAVFMC